MIILILDFRCSNFISNRKNDIETEYHIQFFNISSAYGQWYVTGYNFETNSPKVFRCDKISAVKECNQYQPKPLDEFIKVGKTIYKLQNSIDYEVEISQRGVDLFHKEHYPSMKLYIENERFFIRVFYNKGEENFIANYFITYGENILTIKPVSIKKLIVEKLHSLKKYITDI